MLPFQKKIVTDEAMQPVAVMIDYQDWQKIEKILATYEENNLPNDDISNYAGIITLHQDPLEYQQEIRNQWP